MTREGFIKELTDKFVKNGNWYNYRTQDCEIAITKRYSAKVYSTYGFKVTEYCVYFCFRDYIYGSFGCRELKGKFPINHLNEFENIDVLINDIKTQKQ